MPPEERIVKSVFPLALSTFAMSGAVAAAAPVVPGCKTTLYSTVPATYRSYTACFDAEGRLYLGSDNNESTGELIRRVPAGGGPSETITTTRIYDADGVLVDSTGAITGVAGTVLVACSTFSGAGGVIYKIDSSGSVSEFVTQGAELNNCDAMALDNSGNLLINVPGKRTIARRTTGAFSTYINLAATGGGVLAVDSANKLWISCGDGVVRRFNISTANPAFESSTLIGGAEPGLGYCPAGIFGNSIYCVNRSSGLLYRVSPAGDATVAGSGFPTGAYSLAFNERGEMFVPDWSTGQIWRLSCGADFNSDGFLTFEDFDEFVTAFESGNPDSDFNKDGFLDFSDFDDFVIQFESGC
jgi:sugar lactone lactonase YvrE